MTCHVISQAAITSLWESHFGANNVSFEINFRLKKFFEDAHIWIALPKKIIFNVFFFQVMKYCKLELLYLYLKATNNTKFTGKSSLILFCAESSEKNFLDWCTIFHELKSVVKAKIAQNNSQVSEGNLLPNQVKILFIN